VVNEALVGEERVWGTDPFREQAGRYGKLRWYTAQEMFNRKDTLEKGV